MFHCHTLCSLYNKARKSVLHVLYGETLQLGFAHSYHCPELFEKAQFSL